jgi:PAS domain S-box-containing protein
LAGISEDVLAGERVLIIEDNPECVEFLLTNVLSPHGYLAQTANGGRAGLRAAQEERPDLVLLDLDLKDVRSSEMLQQLQVAGDAPVILMTAPGAEAEALQAFRWGARDALIKPFSAQEMAQAIARVLHQERLSEERDWLVRRLAAANEELERSLAEVQTLYEVGKTVSSSLNLQEVLMAVVQAAVSITRAEEGYLLLRDQDNDELYLRAAQMVRQAHHDDLGEERATSLRLRTDDGIAGHVLRSGEPVILSNASDELLHVRVNPLGNGLHPVRSLINVPLRCQGQVIGVLGVDNLESDRDLTQRDVMLLSALADYAAIAINNAQVYTRADETLNRRLEETFALLAVGQADEEPARQALAHAMRVTGASEGVVGLTTDLVIQSDVGRERVLSPSEEITWINHAGAQSQPEPHLESIVRLALDSGQPQWKQDGMAATPSTYLATPIRQGDRVLGAIGLQVHHAALPDHDRQADALAQENLRFLRELAERVADRLSHAALSAQVGAIRHKSELILQLISEGILTVNQDLRITSVNPALERITGWSESELLGRRYDQVFAPEADGQRLAPEQTLPGMATRSMTASAQSTILCKDGRRIPVSGSAAVLGDGVLATLCDLTPEIELEQLRHELAALLTQWLHAPLTYISSSARTLLQANLPHDVRREILDLLQAQSVRLDQLAEEMLDTLRLEAGATPPRCHPVTLKPIIDQVVKHFQVAASDRPFQVRLAPELPFVIGDESKIELALANLIDNALAVGDPQQPIVIAANATDDCVIVTVVSPCTAGTAREHEKLSAPSPGPDGHSTFDRGPVPMVRQAHHDGLPKGPVLMVRQAHHDGLPKGPVLMVRQAHHDGLPKGPVLSLPKDDPPPLKGERHVMPEMGLYIARKLIRAQGGQIWVEEQPGTCPDGSASSPRRPAEGTCPDGSASSPRRPAEGTGLRFHFSLPRIEVRDEDQALID